MKHYFIFCIFLLFIFPGTAAAKSDLLRMTRIDNSDMTQILFTFDALPVYSHQVSGKRIDVFFEETQQADPFELLPTDQKIVKNLIDTHRGRTRVSFFLRYPPQKVKVDLGKDKKVILEIISGNAYSDVYRDFSKKFSGISIVEDDRVDYANPLVTSPYKYDWPSFLTLYDPPLNINVPVHYTLPPFPVVRQFPGAAEHFPDALPDEVITFGAEESWAEIQAPLLNHIQLATDNEVKKVLALTYGEILLRQGRHEDAYRQFYLLAEKYPEELVGFWARYLLIRTGAEYGDPYLAAIEAEKLAETIPETSTLLAYLHILRIEAALATAKPDDMKRLLNIRSVAIPEELLRVVEIRQSDLNWATHKYVPAYAGYKSITPHLLERYPYSLNGYCDTLYRYKHFEKAADCYKRLSLSVTDKDPSGLIAYRHAVSKLQYMGSDNFMDLFTSIEETFPDTEAGFRAALKKNDYRYMEDNTWADQAIKYYRALAENSLWSDISEEAYVKEALIHSLNNNPENALPILMKVRREFHSGELKPTAEALLLFLLPDEIKRLIDNGQYLKALTLARRNRTYFQKNWIPESILDGIAVAFQKSNLNSEAEKILLYLYDTAREEKKESYFLSIIQVIYDQGKYSLVDDYASQYAYLYPDGKDKAQILDLRLHALVLLGKYQDALDLLPSPLPEDQQIRILAATIFYYTDAYSDTIRILSDIDIEDLAKKEIFILAESYFHTDKYEKAEPLYLSSVEEDYHKEQSLYRLAKIARSRGEDEKSLKFYEQIVETDKDSIWAKYAEKELQYLQLTEEISRSLDG